MTERIPKAALAAARREMASIVSAQLNRLLADTLRANPSLTVRIIAARLDWSKKRFLRSLKNPLRLSLRDMSDIAWSMGAVFEFSVKARGAP